VGIWPSLNGEQVMYVQRKWSFVVFFCFVFSSCATVQGLKKDVKSTYNKVAGKDVSEPRDEVQEPAQYYVAVESLKLYPEPRFSKNHIAVLPLNEKVLRYKLSEGFAYVKVERTGEMGWLENSSLNWKKVDREAPPVTEEGSESMPQETVSEPDAAEETINKKDSYEGPATDQIGAGEAQAAPIPPTQQSEKIDEEDEETKKPNPSIFDSF